MAFKKPKGSAASLESPELLFNDLRNRQVKGLLAHQADILREYNRTAADRADVAIQMPTGSGKTLVGLLIAEWRRRTSGTSSLYICPTNQLVHQVADQANRLYGIPAIPFTGPKKDYDAAHCATYQAAESIAITSYSSLFNISPFFEAPGTIVLDDAHSSDGYIASPWTLRVERTNENHSDLFQALVALLLPSVSGSDNRRLTGRIETQWDSTWVEKLPTPRYLELIDPIAALIDSYAQKSSLRYSWSLLRDHLHACHLYFSAHEILIRPLSPPTFTHAPFVSAAQRIYMSATLGEGGDLERIAGRRAIFRLNRSATWDQHSIGRRYFIFAERAMDQVSAQSLYVEFVSAAGRALFLVPDERSAKSVAEWVTRSLPHRVFSARDIEQSKVAFVSTPQAVAVAANRYDGIDLAEEECRLLLIEGLPGAVDLQERFLMLRMGAGRVLDDRILTRIVQAFGRCTRSTTDFSAVVICGNGLNRYLLRPDRRAFFHPELQAELQFGIDQSKDATAPELLENLELFLAQGPEWQSADAEIVHLRSTRSQETLPGSEGLKKAVAAEIAYAEALWSGNFDLALDSAKTALGFLGGDELRGYRAFWYYLAGSAATLAERSGNAQMRAVAAEFYDNARKATNGVRWLYELAKTPSLSLPEAQVDPLALRQVELLEEQLESLGTINNRRFDELEASIRSGIGSDDPNEFERAQESLGTLIGYASGRSKEQGAPDPWWVAEGQFCVVFEDYTDSQPTSTLSVAKARQVSSHPDWIRANLNMAEDGIVIPVLITHAMARAREAAPYLGNVRIWSATAFREWVTRTLQVIRQLRMDYTEPGDLEWRANAATALATAAVSPAALKFHLESLPNAKDSLEPK